MENKDWISPKVDKILIKLSIYFLISLASFYIIAELIGYLDILALAGLFIGAIGTIFYLINKKSQLVIFFPVGFGIFVASSIYLSVGGFNFIIFGIIMMILMMSFLVGIMYIQSEVQRRYTFERPKYFSYELHQEILKRTIVEINNHNIKYENNGSTIILYPEERDKVIFIVNCSPGKIERNMIYIESTWKERKIPLTKYEKILSKVIKSIDNQGSYDKDHTHHCPKCNKKLAWWVHNNTLNCDSCSREYQLEELA